MCCFSNQFPPLQVLWLTSSLGACKLENKSLINWISLHLKSSHKRLIHNKGKQTVSSEFWLASRKVHFYCHRFYCCFATNVMRCHRRSISAFNSREICESFVACDPSIDGVMWYCERKNHFKLTILNASLCCPQEVKRRKSVKLRCLWADNFIYFFSHATFNISFLPFSHSSDDKICELFHCNFDCHQSLPFHKRMALSENFSFRPIVVFCLSTLEEEIRPIVWS